MKIYLGLGSNLGDRRRNLRQAIRRLQEAELEVLRVSPVVESPALLPKSAPADWNRPYLNLAIECETQGSPDGLRRHAARIEGELGRSDRRKGLNWSPRPIDIDILLWGDEIIATNELTIPHRALHRRGFVLTPMIALEPRLEIPGRGPKTLLDWSRKLRHHIPLWMGIVNVTPDSFSDGGRFTDWASVEPHIEKMVAAGVHILDLGGQSTRPAAETIDAGEEWSRLAPVLEPLLEKYASDILRPLVSIDTHHPEVAERALAMGVDMINDVSGLSSEPMLRLARSSDCDWIAMHQLTLPVDRAVTLPIDSNPVAEIETWIEKRLRAWEAANLDLDRIVIDPGIGFGKDPLQSLALLRHADQLRKYGFRTLIGHSRKSFLNGFTSDARDRELATVGASLELCRKGVDILRVHNISDHLSAYRGWSHLVGSG